MIASTYGTRLRQALAGKEQLPFMGIYDAFSASLAARQFDALFVSGFGFAASHYGLPDVGFIAWPDLLDFVGRLRCILPDHHLLVDIDDGYCDVEAACHVVSRLHLAGASGIVLEDQLRPRRCGHFGGKQLLAIDAYLEKLQRVLAVRGDLFVVARTDATEEQDIFDRLEAYAAAGADAVLVDGVRDLELLGRLSARVDRPMVFNQIAGGKSPRVSLTQLGTLGVQLVIYSTPCLFAAQAAIESALTELAEADGQLPAVDDYHPGVADCTEVLRDNLARRDAATSAKILHARRPSAAA